MKGRVTIGLVGDRSDSIQAHLAIPPALESAAETLGIAAAYEWVPTERIRSASRVAAFDGLWCVPGSPYRSMEGR
jgi:CTP synthase (UTP-ammonia lyase)